MRRAFTLIELLVVIAIIAILAAILFPVFANAKLTATKTKALSQMKQLALSVMMYADSHDDYFAPSSMRSMVPGEPHSIWPPLIQPFTKSESLFIAAGTNDATFARDWNTRKNQNIGYSDATGVDFFSTAVPGNAPKGTEGFTVAANFSIAEEAAITGLFAVTPNGSNTDPATKERGYVFNPYNGPDSPDGDYKKGLPIIEDYNVCKVSSEPAGYLKPIFARYGADGKGAGETPVIFADGHAKMHSAKTLKQFGKVIWRFR